MQPSHGQLVNGDDDNGSSTNVYKNDKETFNKTSNNCHKPC